MTGSPRIALCLSLVAFGAAGAQQSTCDAIGTARPGPSAPLQAHRPADGTARYDMTVQKSPSDTGSQWLGTMTVTQSTVRCKTDGVVQRVIVYDYGADGQVVDTTLSVASTLAPILERTRKRSGDIVLDFSPGLVRGSMARAGVTRPIHDTLAGPAFNSTDFELVVRSLALRKGLATTLWIYDPEFGGYRAASVDVLRLEPAAATATERVWIVRTRDRRLESTYRIGQTSRALLGIDVRADSVRYHIVRSSSPARAN